MLVYRFLVALGGLCISAVKAQESPTHNGTFMNPILSTGAADPWVIRSGEYYYMTYTTNDNITMLRSKSLTDWNDAESKLVFNPPPGMNYSTDLWAPELHSLNEKWYIIFTGDPNHDTTSPAVDMYCAFNCPAIYHRMYVLESSGGDPWETEYSVKGELDTYDQFAIDGTYFQHAKNLYHVYSCWETAYSSWPANLCITQMSDPWTVASPFSERVIISVPSEPWEKTPYGRSVNDRLSSNEGPEQLTNPKTGQNFIIYSAGRSDNRNYCLGQLELIGDDPMDQGSWKKHDGCVFYANGKEKAYGVGHASFTKSPDGKEDWIVYHGMKDPTDGWSARTIRAQKFGWKEDGSPSFPRPGYGPYAAPSGQTLPQGVDSEAPDFFTT